jgi:hypothetical protein
MSSERGEQVWTRAECKAETGSFAVERTLRSPSIPLPKVDASYEHSKALLLNHLSGVLKNEEKIVLGGREGRRWIIEDKDTRIIEFRVVSIDREIYIFTCKPHTGDGAAADAFFSTIRKKG